MSYRNMPEHQSWTKIHGRCSVNLEYTFFHFINKAEHTVAVCNNTYRALQTDDGGKGKFHPRTHHESPEGEKWYSPTLTLTFMLDVG
jgi:hypothetical protein